VADSNKTQEKDVLTDHLYDGILEYDNPTPGWWHMIFFGTIIFSVMYALVYHFSPMVPSHEQRVEAALRREMEQKFGQIAKMPDSNEKYLTIMANPDWLEAGKRIFQSKCVICHGPNGEGFVGPNLTDDKYKNVRELKDIFRVIRDGAGNGQMPAQNTLLNSGQMSVVAAYVASLRGKNLPSGKELPEEVPIDPWPTLESTGDAPAGEGGAG